MKYIANEDIFNLERGGIVKGTVFEIGRIVFNAVDSSYVQFKDSIEGLEEIPLDVFKEFCSEVKPKTKK